VNGSREEVECRETRFEDTEDEPSVLLIRNEWRALYKAFMYEWVGSDRK